jgi:RNA polymerase sigma-70 factor (ECF subfamily)
VDKHHDTLGSGENKEHDLERDENQMMLQHALDRLPAEKREILLLSKYQDRKYKEIGEILGCSEGAVKVKVFRALQELKVAFGVVSGK